MRNMTPAALRIQKARTTLLLDHPFFGTLLFRLKSQESYRVPTMATDGVSLFYNPEFVDTLNSTTLAGVLAHEVMHPALQHHVRRSGRNSRRWNEACDYAINPLLVDAGLSLPEGVLLDSRFSGMSAEQIYVQLESKEQPQSSNQDRPAADLDGDPGGRDQGQGERGSQPVPVTEGGIGQVLDAPLPDAETPSIEEQGRDWSVAVHQAVTISKQAGKTPAGLARTLDGAAEATLDWRELLHRLWSETTPADFSWARPNRRHIWNGLYLPGVVRDGVGEIAIAVDCSGSVNGHVLRLFEAEIRSILESQRPQRVHVLYFDTAVNRVDTFEGGQSVQLAPEGGGGTEFGPCFNWLEEHGIRPRTLIFLTDLYGGFPDIAPEYPVIWASTGSRHAPFGNVVPMQAA